MRDLELNFLFNFDGHKGKGSRANGKSPMNSRTSSTTKILPRYGTARRTLFRFFPHHCIELKLWPLSVPYWLNHVNQSKQVPADLLATAVGRAGASSRRVRLITPV